MITPILENLVIQGLATVKHKTVGQNGVSTISVPENQSIVITKISIQPFINPSFKDGFGLNSGNTGTVNTINNFIQQCLQANTQPDGTINNPAGTSNIVYEMLKRGTFQIELVSNDNNNTIFTFGTDFNFVNVNAPGTPESAVNVIMLLPSLSERSTDCFSVHKNNVHVRLRFINSSIQTNGTDFITQFKNYVNAVSSGDLRNTLPENRPNVDINSSNLYFNTVVYSGTTTGNFGFYPFGIETNYESSGLKNFNSSDTIIFPYLDDPANQPLAGDGGEASFYANLRSSGSANLLPFMNAFIPYINIEYVLINEKADGGTLVKAERYNSVTVKK